MYDISTMTTDELRRAVAELVDAIDTIVANWVQGDLSDAVNEAEACADMYRSEPLQRVSLAE